MTFVCAVIAAGAFLAIGMILLGNALLAITKRLSEIEANLGEVRVGVSRLMMANANSDAKASSPEPKPIALDQREVASQDHEFALPSPGLQPDLTEVDELCARLIALTPPAEALPLLSEKAETPVTGFASRKLIPWPDSMARVREGHEADMNLLGGATALRLIARFGRPMREAAWTACQPPREKPSAARWCAHRIDEEPPLSRAAPRQDAWRHQRWQRASPPRLICYGFRILEPPNRRNRAVQ
jgi:hypothetical protein